MRGMFLGNNRLFISSQLRLANHSAGRRKMQFEYIVLVLQCVVVWMICQSSCGTNHNKGGKKYSLIYVIETKTDHKHV